MPEASFDGASGFRSSGPGDPDEMFGKRMLALFGLFILCVTIVIGRIAYWQFWRGAELREETRTQVEKKIPLKARRGTIYDRNGNVLAMSEECRTIQCHPNQVENPYLTAKVIAEHLGGETNDYVDILTTGESFAYIKKTVSIDVAEGLMNALYAQKLDGIESVSDTRRVYPYGAVGSQVLGIVGADGDGISGLELYYDKVLRGIDGETRIEMGANYDPIADAVPVTTEAIDGTDIVISLDINVQRVAEEKIVEGVKEFKAESGSVMVTDPRSGEILAACSTPLFDITDLTEVEDGATSIKVVTNSYEPGSIFKILTSAIGIEEGIVSPTTTFYVPAYVEVGDDLVHDDDDRSYDMNMSLREILRRSSNTGAALVAQDYIGADAFAAGVASFGIGQPTGIDYPGEVEGIVKSREEYDGSSVGSMSFGQGLAIPLVQMVRAVGAVANRGVPYTPHFLVSKGTRPVEWEPGDRIVSQTTATQVVDMMRTVVEEGTGTKAQVEGYDVAGKTGTGELADTAHGGYVADKFTSSLIGFAPAADPEVLVYVGLNGTPYLAYASAGPVFSSIMGEALADMGVLPST